MDRIDISAPAPRVNFELMAQYIGKRVKLVGKVESVQNNVMKVKAADDGVVDVLLVGAAPTDTFVEFEGTVESPNTMRGEATCGFGNNFDMGNYNELCKLVNGDYKDMFSL